MKSVDESYFKVVVFKGQKLDAYHLVDNIYKIIIIIKLFKRRTKNSKFVFKPK